MGRPRLTDQERALRGDAGKRVPKRDKAAGTSIADKSAPKPAASPAAVETKPVIPARIAPHPPVWLTNLIAREEWERLAPELVAMRVLSAMDYTALGLYCQAFASWLSATMVIAEKGAAYLTKSKHGEMERARPEVKIAAEAEKTMLRYGQQFGLAPLARSRVASGFLQNGQQLPLPGFEVQPVAPKQTVPIQNDDSQPAPPPPEGGAKAFFGYH